MKTGFNVGSLYKRPLLFTFLLPLTCSVAPSQIFAQNGWKVVDSISDTASPVAESLASKMAPKLIAEGTKVVFLNISKCVIPGEDLEPSKIVKVTEEMKKKAQEENIKDNEAWCHSFQTSLESALIAKGIRFLSEGERNAIRDKIASEEGYQYSSMQVDVSKAVELGRQKAFQAFVTVTINPNGPKRILVSANAINIKEGVVSLSEKVKVTNKSDLHWSIGSIIGGSFALTLGLSTAAYGHIHADKENQLSNDQFKIYKSASNTDQATESRKSVEDHDKKAAYYNSIAAVGWVLILGSGYYLLASNETVISYKLEAMNQPRESIDKPKSLLTWAPFIETSGHYGISLNLTLNN